MINCMKKKLIFYLSFLINGKIILNSNRYCSFSDNNKYSDSTHILTRYHLKMHFYSDYLLNNFCNQLLLTVTFLALQFKYCWSDSVCSGIF